MTRMLVVLARLTRTRSYSRREMRVRMRELTRLIRQYWRSRETHIETWGMGVKGGQRRYTSYLLRGDLPGLSILFAVKGTVQRD